MSLLIKALATAEKDKQAELKKKQADIGHAPQSLELAPLLPIDAALGQVVEAPNLAEEVTTTNATREQTETKALELTAALGNGLSLEEETGFAAAKMAENNSAKSRAASNKVSAKFDAPHANNKAEAFNAAALASVAHVKSQAASAQDSKQKAAANVFVANQSLKNTSSKSALILLGIAGALMVWLGLQGYHYIKDVTAPEVVVVRPAPQAMDSNTVVSVDVPELPLAETQVLSESQNTVDGTTEEMSHVNAKEDAKHNEAAPKKLMQKNNALTAEEEVINATDSLLVAEDVAKRSSANLAPVRSAKNAVKNTGDATSDYAAQAPANRQALKLVSKIPAAGVDPTLLAAYQAFSRGEDAAAQQQYRQVLQRDVRNIDALLGMAAIAQRQGRDADAMGWYQKVLEIEPRNTIAQSSMTSIQVHGNSTGSNSAEGGLANVDAVGTESRIKSMLAQQPEAANLHAALGNLFAAQNQWPAAQEAYFNASRFAPANADYAFNLAISLDHLGKSGLALAQYQRALDLLNSSGATSPDRAQLEARIQALQ